MASDVIEIAFKGVMPYLAPLVLILSAVKVAERLSELMASSFKVGGRRSGY